MQAVVKVIHGIEQAASPLGNWIVFTEVEWTAFNDKVYNSDYRLSFWRKTEAQAVKVGDKVEFR